MIERVIYYGDWSVVRGIYTPGHWLAAPDDDVQVVAKMEPYPDVDGQPFRPWAGVDDRQLWTGQRRYDPWGWGVKLGAWMRDEDYQAIWARARVA